MISKKAEVADEECHRWARMTSDKQGWQLTSKDKQRMTSDKPASRTSWCSYVPIRHQASHEFFVVNVMLLEAVELHLMIFSDGCHSLWAFPYCYCHDKKQEAAWCKRWVGLRHCINNQTTHRRWRRCRLNIWSYFGWLWQISETSRLV